MTQGELLTLLKADLQMRTESNDAYLLSLLDFALLEMQRVGITITENDAEQEMIQVHWAAYLFRKRGGDDTQPPRFLKREVNNLLMSQKGKVQA